MDSVHDDVKQNASHVETCPATTTKMDTEAGNVAEPVRLTWRSYAVFTAVTFGLALEVLVIVSGGQVLSFIARDLGEPSLVGWVVQAPLLMQSALSPLIGRLSDTLGRKYVAAIPPLVAAMGAILSARATSMGMLIGGSVLWGVTLTTAPVLRAIATEIMPLKYRVYTNASAFAAGAIGGTVGSLAAGALVNASPSGWRNIFWVHLALHLTASASILGFYNPRRVRHRETKWTSLLWALDPVGSLLFVVGATLVLLALNWSGSTYVWGDAHIIAPLTAGVVLLGTFGVYEWKGRNDGVLPHVLFQNGRNFPLASLVLIVEGWVYYGVINNVLPRMFLHLGFARDSLRISVLLLSYGLPTIFACIPVAIYTTKTKDFRLPLIISYLLFAATTVSYANITPQWKSAFLGINVVSGIANSGPLAVLMAALQYSAPHAHLSTATGCGLSARALGGALGSAVFTVILNNELETWSASVVKAAVTAGMPRSSSKALVVAMNTEQGFDKVPGLTEKALHAAEETGRLIYSHAFRMAWWSVFAAGILALICVVFLSKIDKNRMTNEIEATVEKVQPGGDRVELGDTKDFVARD
ncbi:major facilitator superfamily domain-containing protein [Coniochaeta sp. 2T2.1]|nr:major facilitator superfamily domain-containing protein [Coniochaeta sp. 2T2.1]